VVRLWEAWEGRVIKGRGGGGGEGRGGSVVGGGGGAGDVVGVMTG